MPEGFRLMTKRECWDETCQERFGVVLAMPGHEDFDPAPQTAPQWIPVGERLPELDATRLDSAASDHVLAFWSTRDPDNEPAGIEVSWFDGRYWQDGRGNMDYHGTRRVTHWLPLPPPPADEQEVDHAEA